ncbi:MAG: DUF1549 domain-containing protein [Planctomycetota bacterium]|nr:MAG: DUF1549 domain-containing protein [Planctomycetota bacterium]
MRRPPLPSPMALLLATLVSATALSASAAADEIDFGRDIQPILAEKCALCHGPDEAGREADLRIDVRDSAVAAAAIVPGDPDSSELMVRILSEDPDEVMPPPDQQKPITAAERELLRRWIEEGAPYEQHWAFVAPRRAEMPEDAHPVDAFVRARLDEENLKPAAQADRATLLRRLSLDLTGLPPTLEELDAFLADESPDAYEKQVERLLASPHYGERWARWWMDAARYADSDGYEKDLPRQQWAWRDWVVGALNRDLPYDQFIIQQIAGDQLPDAGQDERIATGFLRNSMVNEEGAIIPEEFRIEGIIDRIDCIGKAVLGMSLACGQCHDHKYDPLSQREYYQLFAYLNNDYESIERVYSPAHRQRMTKIDEQIVKHVKEIKKAVPDWEAKLQTWATAEREKQTADTWTPLHPSSAEVPDGICHPEILDDGTVLNLGFRPTSTRLTVIVDTQETEVTALRLDALTHGDLIFGGPGRNFRGTFAISEIKVDAAPLSDAENFSYVKVAEATANANKSVGLIDPFFRRNKDDRRLTGGANFLVDDDLNTAWCPDRGPRWRNEDCHAVLRFEEPLRNEGGTRFRIAMGFRHGGADAHGRRNNFIGRFRVSVTDRPEPRAAQLPSEVGRALAKPTEELSAEDRQNLIIAWARSEEDTKMLAGKIDEQWSAWPEGDSVLNLATREAKFQRRTYLLDRGNWQSPTTQVEPGTPAAFHALPDDAPATRLTLARWLVDRQSPTTARVIVNRVWQTYFGLGLVTTPEDFGTRAERPTHPQLLDTLAVELMEPTVPTAAAEPPQPWSLKHLHRLIVTSATYRQSSQVSAELLERDPNNKLLARGPRFRPHAETVRDIALTASGLLNREMGGPSVFPPVPEGLFALSFVHVDFWNTATGPDRYRRSIYVFRRRSIPDPVLANFDAPTGDQSCVRRVRSNTPLAALTSLNATIFSEAAQALALRVLREGGSTDAERIRYAFRLCTSRPPRETEVATLKRLLDRSRKRLLAGELDAAQIAFNEFTKPGDLPPTATPNDAAAWTIVARVLLNLDATLTKG